MYDVAVVGLGYVGLPLVVEASRSGMRVLAIDIDASRVSALITGVSHVEDVGDDDVAMAIAAGMRVTTDHREVANSPVVLLCVPTPLRDGSPDLSAIEAAGRAIAPSLAAGSLVILESSTYPGTTEEVLGPLLAEGSGLDVGAGLFVAYSPERIDPRNPTWGLRNTPKIVGGIDEASTLKAVAFYESICDVVVPVSGTREAEMAKLLENTYRHVNIALVNELAMFCHELGIDIWEVIRAAATKPFGFEAFYPGPGVGGHCIPIDPSYLSFKVRQLGYQARLIEAAQDINSRMPGYVVKRITEMLNRYGLPLNGTTIHLVGVAYKPDVSDLRSSPALDIVRRLRAQGAEVVYSDPHVPFVTVDGISLARLEDPVKAAGTSQISVLLTPHTAFDLDEIAKHAKLFFDTRGIVAGAESL